jgi:hypothetical protein
MLLRAQEHHNHRRHRAAATQIRVHTSTTLVHADVQAGTAFRL